MIRDPSYFLKKAEYYRDLADCNDSEDNIKKEIVANIKPAYQRYYDPITKHYFKTEKILGLEPIIRKKVENPAETDVWYPENKISDRVRYDPRLERYVLVDKLYDPNGKFKIECTPLNHYIEKSPGTNYYRAVYHKN